VTDDSHLFYLDLGRRRGDGGLLRDHCWPPRKQCLAPLFYRELGLCPYPQSFRQKMSTTFWNCQTWWYTPIIPELRRLRQENCEIESSLGYLVRPCLKKQINKTKTNKTLGKENEDLSKYAKEFCIFKILSRYWIIAE
jgi:hypothetical protein